MQQVFFATRKHSCCPYGPDTGTSKMESRPVSRFRRRMQQGCAGTVARILPQGIGPGWLRLSAIASFFVLALAVVPAPGLADEAGPHRALELSPNLSNLLRAEMAELAQGVSALALFLASADWAGIERTSRQMHESYILTKSLTPALKEELTQKLPAEFKRLDAAFHARALKLRDAAKDRDPELSVFHFSRLVEACASCHSAYAPERFPGFREDLQERHGH